MDEILSVPNFQHLQLFYCWFSLQWRQKTIKLEQWGLCCISGNHMRTNILIIVNQFRDSNKSARLQGVVLPKVTKRWQETGKIGAEARKIN